MVPGFFYHYKFGPYYRLMNLIVVRCPLSFSKMAKYI